MPWTRDTFCPCLPCTAGALHPIFSPVLSCVGEMPWVLQPFPIAGIHASFDGQFSLHNHRVETWEQNSSPSIRCVFPTLPPHPSLPFVFLYPLSLCPLPCLFLRWSSHHVTQILLEVQKGPLLAEVLGLMGTPQTHITDFLHKAAEFSWSS